jgi:dTDP-4-dehydrorhamnose reductase
MNEKVLVLGGAGMLGHKIVQTLGQRFDVWATFREAAPPELLAADRAVRGVDATEFDTVDRALREVRPGVVVNCIGVVKQRAEAHDPVLSITINSLLPHRLARICGELGARVIHISTDCVFTGRKGSYLESDTPDAEDLYGRTKLLGEVEGEGALTLRTSIIGRELRSTTGLVEWFLSNRGGAVDGYTEAIFSGLTTLALSRLIADVIERHQDLSGLYHVAADPISKYDLLVLLDQAFHTNAMITPSTALRIDRSLDATRFRQATGWRPESWAAMVTGLAQDPTPYDRWRTL